MQSLCFPKICDFAVPTIYSRIPGQICSLSSSIARDLRLVARFSCDLEVYFYVTDLINLLIKIKEVLIESILISKYCGWKALNPVERLSSLEDRRRWFRV